MAGKSRRSQRSAAGGFSTLPHFPPASPAATLAGGENADLLLGRAPVVDGGGRRFPAALPASSPGENYLLLGFVRFVWVFSAFRWLLHLRPCSTPKGVTAAPAARSEMSLVSF